MKKILPLLFVLAMVTLGCISTSITGSTITNMDKEETMTPTATIETDKGTIKFELYKEQAPITTKNFIDLTLQGFYDGLIFHRVEPGFVVQGGDPKGDGTGGSGKNIPLEVKPELKHVKGAVAMARSSDPNSASSQFYITLVPTPFLDGQYAVFGKVIEGMDVVESIKVGTKMTKVTVQG